jgi:hypothetical protein
MTTDDTMLPDDDLDVPTVIRDRKFSPEKKEA